MGRIIKHPSTIKAMKAAMRQARNLMCKCGHRAREHKSTMDCRKCIKYKKHCDGFQPIGKEYR